jgi:hypothetical protein
MRKGESRCDGGAMGRLPLSQKRGLGLGAAAGTCTRLDVGGPKDQHKARFSACTQAAFSFFPYPPLNFSTCHPSPLKSILQPRLSFPWSLASAAVRSPVPRRFVMTR